MMEGFSTSWWTVGRHAGSSTSTAPTPARVVGSCRQRCRTASNLAALCPWWLLWAGLMGCSTPKPTTAPQAQYPAANLIPPSPPRVRSTGVPQRNTAGQTLPLKEYLVLNLGGPDGAVILEVSAVPTGFTPLLTLPTGSVIVHDYDYTNVPARFYRLRPLP